MGLIGILLSFRKFSSLPIIETLLSSDIHIEELLTSHVISIL